MADLPEKVVFGGDFSGISADSDPGFANGVVPDDHGGIRSGFGNDKSVMAVVNAVIGVNGRTAEVSSACFKGCSLNIFKEVGGKKIAVAGVPEFETGFTAENGVAGNLSIPGFVVQ